jgi:hypothetical protein
MAAARPKAVTIRAYQMGFGDCFLLTFHYLRGARGMDRHVLIDFGSTGAPRGFGDLAAVAQSIKAECGGKLHAVVATHRHQDHISGFATDGGGPGEVIASCDPDVVVQPWTEDPDAQPDATAAPLRSSRSQAFVASLRDMHAVAQAVLDEAPRLESLLDSADLEDDDAEPESDEETPADGSPGPRKRQRPLFKNLRFMGDNNLPNRSAIANLQRMGRRHVYVHTGAESGLESLLPGVKITVLGPPTLEQTGSIRRQRQRDESEFWQFQAQASQLAANPTAERLFPQAPVLDKRQWPKWSRWLIPRLRGIRGEQLREMVRVLDSALNNTSVILLFEVGRHKLLFPGDAQIENWQYALSQKRYQNLLRDVTFYKVGHHGSMNATPKSLWHLFARRSRGLRTLVSTMKGKHGDRRRSTEVPRTTLVKALMAESHFFSTESIHVRDGLFHAERIEI